MVRTISTFEFSKRELTRISRSSLLLAFKKLRPAAHLCPMPTLDVATLVNVGNDVCFLILSSFAEVGVISWLISMQYMRKKRNTKEL
jgi:hypothetical protein